MARPWQCLVCAEECVQRSVCAEECAGEEDESEAGRAVHAISAGADRAIELLQLPRLATGSGAVGHGTRHAQAGGAAQKCFAALSERLLVPPVLRTLLYDRDPEAVRRWVSRITDTEAGWEYERVLPAHFGAPVRATPADVHAAFAFLDDPTADLPPRADLRALCRIRAALEPASAAAPPCGGA